MYCQNIIWIWDGIVLHIPLKRELLGMSRKKCGISQISSQSGPSIWTVHSLWNLDTEVNMTGERPIMKTFFLTLQDRFLNLSDPLSRMPETPSSRVYFSD